IITIEDLQIMASPPHKSSMQEVTAGSIPACEAHQARTPLRQLLRTPVRRDAANSSSAVAVPLERTAEAVKSLAPAVVLSTTESVVRPGRAWRAMTGFLNWKDVMRRRGRQASFTPLPAARSPLRGEAATFPLKGGR